MAKQALLFHAQKTSCLRITEPIAYDGLENFARSQYEPNYINHAIGRDSLFIYDFNFSPLNRKGRMSDRQKLKKLELERDLGKFPKDAIAHATYQIVKRLLDKTSPAQPLHLLTDEHFQYKNALCRMKKENINHQTVSAKASRTYKNILFPVNHTDLLTRQRVKAFARETISFSKTHVAMVQKYALFSLRKNYMKAQFTKKHAQNPLSNKQTPAQAVGLTDHPLRFGEIFAEKLFRSHAKLCKEWALFYDKQVPYPRSTTWTRAQLSFGRG